LSIFLWLATVGWTVVVAAAIIDGAPGLLRSSRHSPSDAPSWRPGPSELRRTRWSATCSTTWGLTAFGGRADRLEARLLRGRLGTVRWSGLTEVRTRAARSGIDLEFISSDGSRPVPTTSESRCPYSSWSAAAALTQRAHVSPGHRTRPWRRGLRLRHRPGRRRWLAPTVICGRDGSVGLGYAVTDTIRISVIAVGFVIVGAFFSVHQEMAPYSPRAATIFRAVISIVVIASVMGLAQQALRAGVVPHV
jgi:hypothetical protein